MRRAWLVVFVAACANFQDPDIVVDLRVLSIVAEPANQVVDISASSQPADILAQLVPTTVCALTSDPSFDGGLDWTMTMCNVAINDRCTDGTNDGSAISPQIFIGSGTIADPDTTSPEPQLCGTIQPNDDLASVLLNSIENDPLMGLGGVDYAVLLEVGDVGSDRSNDQFAAKNLQVIPRIPPTVTQNHNPTISGMTAAVDGSDAEMLPLGRCADLAATNTTPLIVNTDDVVRFTPLEPPGIHEVYVVPTIDGGSQMFTEAISYQWNAGSGSFSSDSTGGPVDVFGNTPPLYTDWTAPDSISDVTDVPLFLIQRDDRLGEAWFEACIRVMP
ncbi:MAG TPA: hypothetical protein VH143_13945 [Kofleriaceae bacterium]|nr:hypothetical protein [Kofleriaceae bacterium]